MSSEVTVEIKYDNQDITPYVIFSEARFTSRTTSSTPGECIIPLRDAFQEFTFIPGKHIGLWINGVREWDGYLTNHRYAFFFEGHTADCHPCPHVTPRKLILEGADRNILASRRYMHDPVDPVAIPDKIWPAGTTDREILVETIAQYLHPTDSIDYDTRIEEVAPPDPWQEYRVPAAMNPLESLLSRVARSTGAVTYIDPDRYLVYTDVNTETAPFRISDHPNNVGEVGCRDFTILHSADEMINDAMIWGVGQGKDHVTFDRVTDDASVALHGRWQNQGGFRYDLWRNESVHRVANSIVYGSPSSKRGHKDDKVVVTCTIFDPGLRVADKVRIRSEVHGFSDVIPIREMTISFPTPTHAQYDLRLSHEIDAPWTTVEYWWPRGPEGGGGRQPPGGQEPPILNCTIPLFAMGTTANTISPGFDPTIRGTHRSGYGSVHWHVKIEFGINVWYWHDHRPPDEEWHDDSIHHTVTRTQYVHTYVDEVVYGGLMTFYPVRMHDPGEEEWTWFTDYRYFRAPPNTQWPGLGVIGLVTVGASFRAWQEERIRIGDADSGDSNPEPHVVQISKTHPQPPIDPATGQTQYREPRLIGSAYWENTVTDGWVSNFDIVINAADNEHFYLYGSILEANFEQPIAQAHFDFSATIEWRNRLPAGYIGLPGCQEVPLYGPTCVTPTHDHGLIYRVPVAYRPGSLEVRIDGLPLIPDFHFTESDPSSGEFELLDALEPFFEGGEPYACYEAVGMQSYPSIPADGSLFLVPTSGSISGTFGAQTATWDPAIWHGTYYEHFHNGVDFGVAEGTTVYASAAGDVVYEDQAAGGTMIHIYHANGMRTTYAHLSSRLVANGASVTQGQAIALSGSSGTVTGAHLHWGLVYGGWPEDPLPYSNYVLNAP